MKFLDFFAGIGGFRRGMELAGHTCVGFCEWDKYAVASYTSMHLVTDEQRARLSTLALKQRQKEILKEVYRGGEWYANDIRNVDAGSLPEADCWCFGAPCQDFSIAGKRAGLDGDRSSLIREIFRLLEEQKEEDRPEWLIYENVKGMLYSNRGLDYLSILSEMDRLGYDIEWQNINSRWFVPQNRERIYTIGHLRKFGKRTVLPVTGADGENSVCQIGQLYGTEKEPNPSGGRFYNVDGCCPSLGAGHGMPQPQVGIKVIGSTKPQLHSLEDVRGTDGIMSCLTGRDYKCPKQIGIKLIGEINSSQDGKVHDASGIAQCHSAGHGNTPKVAIPVLTPDRVEKRQNGRRFKENGEPMFTLTAQDRHGVALDIKSFYSKTRGKPERTGFTPALDHNCNIGVVEKTNIDIKQKDGIYVETAEGFLTYCVWYEKYQCYITVRKLTPKECFRLQGWTDDYFKKAAFVNSDSQLYKQAGNGVTVNVVREIGRKIPR